MADSSLAQDRLTKAASYAAAGVPELWILNLRDDRVEVFRRPDHHRRRCVERLVRRRGERPDLVSLPDASVVVADLLPTPAAR